jgi:inner membrane transporter RhtA
VDALGVAWLRIATAAAVFALWRRPWRALARLDGPGRRVVAAWGGVLALMNACFYLAIAALPLATVAAIEFLPVVVLAALGARTRRNAGALVLAVPGVYLVTGVQLEGELLGVALAFANALLFSYALLVALLPATAAVVGALVLSQVPSATEAAGIALVIAGVALHRTPPAGAPDGGPAADAPEGRGSRRPPPVAVAGGTPRRPAVS